jgi:hypothetical protein
LISATFSFSLVGGYPPPSGHRRNARRGFREAIRHRPPAAGGCAGVEVADVEGNAGDVGAVLVSPGGVGVEVPGGPLDEGRLVG